MPDYQSYSQAYTEIHPKWCIYWSQRVTLFGYNAVLDDIITQVFQELDFDETIFTHPNFKDIAGFALSKSISLKRLSINDWDEEDVFAQVDIAQTVLDFMESFQNMDVVARYPPKGTVKYLEYRDIDSLTDVVNKWRSFISSGSTCTKSQRSLKLSISQSEEVNITSHLDILEDHINQCFTDHINQCFTDLLSVISNNRDIMTTSIHINIYMKPTRSLQQQSYTWDWPISATM
ncbi:unnamed protein product [Ambrosiozyma monospora]|uniref:Unnamed protein product n=1 Tax=Ambrosiozyma monospora TaxID=43982 RepID=A0ACB5TXV4_AMBMO|nr:unnamed protein product [Ambrosiozyma monospora]